MLEEMNFSLDDFTHSNWHDIIALVEKKICGNYSTLFAKEARQATEAGDTTRYQIFLLLHSISDLLLKPEEVRKPFAPMYIWDNSRSVDIIDFGESHVALLKEIFEQIDDPDLRSRAGDVIWTCQHKGNFSYAEAAIDAYLIIGEKLLLTEDYYTGLERFTRSIHLAASLGKNSKKFREVITKIETLVDQYSPLYSPFVGRLLELLYKYRQGNSKKNALIAESLADFDHQRHIWYLERAHWNAAARWHQLGENPESAQPCQLREAECYVFEAEDALKNSSQGMQCSVAARHLQSAIEALRKIPGTETRQRELHIQMLDLQANSHDELNITTQELDLTPHVEKAILAVKDKLFLEALFTFCLIGSSPRKQSLREMVDQLASKHPLLSWISMNVLDERGRVVGTRGSMFSGTPDEIEAAKIADMHQKARYEQEALGVVVNGVRLQLLSEHTLDLREFLEITSNNPFIPPGREWIFARGYLSGFQGDFLEALHLLVPQVENSLRYLLNRQGVITSKLNSEGIQEESDLNFLLEMPELNQILGDDLVFDLQGTLTNRFGFNFRNLMSHGLLDPQTFYSNRAIYIWWLLLRICCSPLIIAQRQEENKNAETPSQ